MDYGNLEKYKSLLKDRLEWGQLATFVPNKDMPVYNWFYYKEGFARGLVMNCIEMFGLKEGDIVLDPFCGSGTTMLACKEKGINSIGIDVLPVSILATRVKTADYDFERLKLEAKKLLRSKFMFVDSDFPYHLRRFFSKPILDDVMFFKAEVDFMKEDVKDFFLLALARTAMQTSWSYKDGSVLKVAKRHVPPFRHLFRRIIFRMMREKAELNGAGRAKVGIGDARKLSKQYGEGMIDAVITSPPYLNIIDYTKVYEIENWLTEKSKKEDKAPPAVRSYFGLSEGEEGEKKYFQDMGAVLKEMARVMKPGAKAAIVVGNAYFPGSSFEASAFSKELPYQKPPEKERVVEVDLIIAKMAEEAGFKAREIIVLNKRPALEGRTKKVGTLRESMVVLEK